MKKIIQVSVLLITLTTITVGGYWLYNYLGYAANLTKHEEKWINEIFVPSHISGVIFELNEPSNKDCFTNLIIKKNNGEKFASGICLCGNNKLFERFASVGDSVNKYRGSMRIIVKVSGEKREFDFPFCDD